MPIDLVVDERDTASTSGAGAMSGGIGKAALSPGAYHPGHVAGDLTGSHDQVSQQLASVSLLANYNRCCTTVFIHFSPNTELQGWYVRLVSGLLDLVQRCGAPIRSDPEM